MNQFAVPIDIEKYEMEMACQVAIRRQIDAEYSGMRDRVNNKPFTEALQAHLLGSLGELCVAKYLGIFWPGHVNTFRKLADIGKSIECRHRSNHVWDLIVRPGDNESSLYVLSSGNGRQCFVHGYMEGSAAKNDKWKMAYGGKPAAYFIPSRELKSPESLRELIRRGSKV